MQSITDCFTLTNGVQIPCVGFGTWQTPDGAGAVHAVQEALAAGYRHIDTAAVYGNEVSVGQAIRQSGLPRESLFITSKLWNDDHGYASTYQAFTQSLQNLGLDYLDLYLIHWPNPLAFRDRWQQANADSWRAMEELYQAGRIRAIGVSNFLPHHLETLLQTARVIPMVNQVRLCPGETQPATTDYCRDHQILIEAYSPLGTGSVFTSPVMQALANACHKSIAQVCLRWSLQMGFLPLPKSVTRERIRENTDLFDFELSAADVRLIAGLTDACGPSANPDTVDF